MKKSAREAAAAAAVGARTRNGTIIIGRQRSGGSGTTDRGRADRPSAALVYLIVLIIQWQCVMVCGHVGFGSTACCCGDTWPKGSRTASRDGRRCECARARRPSDE
jgi:hypothetical protein